MSNGKTNRTPKKRRDWKTPFLAGLAETCNVTESCKRAVIERTYVYEARHNDPDFAKAWDDAIDQGIELLELEARRRAFKGVEVPTTVAGNREVVQKYSDTLAIFLLKAHRPMTYRDRASVEHTGGVRHKHEISNLDIILDKWERKSASAPCDPPAADGAAANG